MHREVNKKVDQNFNPGLALIGLSGTGPRGEGFEGLLDVKTRLPW